LAKGKIRTIYNSKHNANLLTKAFLIGTIAIMSACGGPDDSLNDEQLVENTEQLRTAPPEFEVDEPAIVEETEESEVQCRATEPEAGFGVSSSGLGGTENRIFTKTEKLDLPHNFESTAARWRSGVTHSHARKRARKAAKSEARAGATTWCKAQYSNTQCRNRCRAEFHSGWNGYTSSKVRCTQYTKLGNSSAWGEYKQHWRAKITGNCQCVCSYRYRT
jgi:hypothetical protein